MKLPLRLLAQHCKNFAPLLAAPAALLLLQGQAKAVLTYNIFESAGNVVVQTNGSLNLPSSSIGTSSCTDGAIVSSLGIICTGAGELLNLYGITGPNTFNGSVDETNGTSTSTVATTLGRLTSGLSIGTGFGISSGYISGTPIISSSTFSGTLASLGFTISSGLLGSWTLDGTNDTINVFIGSPAASVPGPLPLLGAGAAFGWSRRLRKRIATPLITTTPQA